MNEPRKQYVPGYPLVWFVRNADGSEYHEAPFAPCETCGWRFGADVAPSVKGHEPCSCALDWSKANPTTSGERMPGLSDLLEIPAFLRRQANAPAPAPAAEQRYEMTVTKTSGPMHVAAPHEVVPVSADELATIVSAGREFARKVTPDVPVTMFTAPVGIYERTTNLTMNDGTTYSATSQETLPMPDPIRRHRTPSDPETLALGAIMRALAPLEAAAKRRVLKYVADKFTEMPGTSE